MLTKDQVAAAMVMMYQELRKGADRRGVELFVKAYFNLSEAQLAQVVETFNTVTKGEKNYE